MTSARDDFYAAIESARAHEKSGDIHAAIEDFTKAIPYRLNEPKTDFWTDPLTERARLYALLEDYPAAIRDYTTAIEKITPDYPLELIDRAECYQRMGDYKHAIADYTDFINLILEEDSDGDDFAVDAFCKRGSAYFEMKQYTEAYRDFAWAYNKCHNSELYLPHKLYAASKLRQMGNKTIALAPIKDKLSNILKDTRVGAPRDNEAKQLEEEKEAPVDLNMSRHGAFLVLAFAELQENNLDQVRLNLINMLENYYPHFSPFEIYLEKDLMDTYEPLGCCRT